MTRTEFRKGDVLFRQDSTAEHVLRVVRGEVEVLREIGGASVVLGHVREGEWLGEMAAIENRSHSATAHAATDCVVESLTARQFLDQVSSSPPLARDVILRLSVRLRRINDKVAGDMATFTGDIRTATGRGGAPNTGVTDHGTILLQPRPMHYVIGSALRLFLSEDFLSLWAGSLSIPRKFRRDLPIF
jgi:CRP/FNR family transcriptional regulator, cyclic AMP receptor protein